MIKPLLSLSCVIFPSSHLKLVVLCSQFSFLSPLYHVPLFVYIILVFYLRFHSHYSLPPLLSSFLFLSLVSPRLSPNNCLLSLPLSSALLLFLIAFIQFIPSFSFLPLLHFSSYSLSLLPFSSPLLTSKLHHLSLLSSHPFSLVLLPTFISSSLLHLFLYYFFVIFLSISPNLYLIFLSSTHQQG